MRYEVLLYCAPSDLFFYEKLIAGSWKPKYNTRPISGPRTQREAKADWLRLHSADWQGKPIDDVAASLFQQMKTEGLYSPTTVSIDGNRIVRYLLKRLVAEERRSA